LYSRGLYQSQINGTFDSITQNASFAFQRQANLHEREPVDDAVLEAARSLGYEVPEPNPPGDYVNRSGRIELSSSDYGNLNRLAYLYYLWTAERITVTSGTRTPREQAEAMYENWYYDRNQGTRYLDEEAEEEILEAYENALRANRGRNATVDAMTAVIENQVRHRRYISRHLIGRAVDVRIRDMSTEQRKIFDNLAKALHLTPLREEDHYHLQF